MFDQLLKALISIKGVAGCVTVDPQDGSVILKEGNINPILEDITAFFGSGFDVVASSLSIKGLRFSYLEKETQKFIILVKEGGYIGCELEPSESFENVIGNILKTEVGGEKPAEEERVVEAEPVSELSHESRFLKSKVRQINLLIDEFSGNEDRSPWVEIVKEKFSDTDIGKKLLESFTFEKNVLSYDGSLDQGIKEEDISSVSKLVTDSLCRKAVEKFGAIEAKKKVHSVIAKLGIAK
jgi:hypothetical protein